MKKLAISIIALTTLSVNAQWNQIGTDIDGEVAGDWSGYVVSSNGDGSVIAIGARENDGSFTNAGHVRVFENNGGSWTQIGSDIDGEAAGDYSGSSLSINDDGTILAIGAPGNNGNGNNSGHVRVYENLAGTWTQIGNDIDGETLSNESGSSVSISNDGKIVAIGAIINDNTNGNDAGHVRVYMNIAGTWTQVGSDIDGESTGDKSGHSVSINGDGSIVAIGAKFNNSGGVDNGHVRVYQNINDVWTQLGVDINGEHSNDNSGHSISLSNDGLTLAIGSPGSDDNGNGSGNARVFRYNTGWTQLGSNISGTGSTNYAGISISLSDDGNKVAVGSSGNSDAGSNSGHVRIYENLNSVWTQVGNAINGEAADDQGAFVSLNNDGSIAIIGGMKNDGNGVDAGHVRVYQFGAVNLTKWPNIEINVYPNPVNSQLTIEIKEQIKSISILGITGKTIKVINDNSKVINVSDLTIGVYFLQVKTNNGILTKKFIKQ